jgi:AbrB family looped-hinge helix DNA binding protein
MAVDIKPVSVRMGNQGRIVIPSELRHALGIVSGEKLVARVEDGRLILETKESITASLQKVFRDAVPEGVSLADELIAERRAEARREEEDS